MPKVITIQLIASEVRRGKGTPDNVARMVEQYHTTDGRLMLENDPYSNDDGITLGQLVDELRAIKNQRNS